MWGHKRSVDQPWVLQQKGRCLMIVFGSSELTRSFCNKYKIQGEGQAGKTKPKMSVYVWQRGIRWRWIKRSKFRSDKGTCSSKELVWPTCKRYDHFWIVSLHNWKQVKRGVQWDRITCFWSRLHWGNYLHWRRYHFTMRLESSPAFLKLNFSF